MLLIKKQCVALLSARARAVINCGLRQPGLIVVMYELTRPFLKRSQTASWLLSPQQLLDWTRDTGQERNRIQISQRDVCFHWVFDYKCVFDTNQLAPSHLIWCFPTRRLFRSLLTWMRFICLYRVARFTAYSCWTNGPCADMQSPLKPSSRENKKTNICRQLLSKMFEMFEFESINRMRGSWGETPEYGLGLAIWWQNLQKSNNQKINTLVIKLLYICIT